MSADVEAEIPSTKENEFSENSTKLSKRQQKKLTKHERWLKLRPLKRAKERAQKKKRKTEGTSYDRSRKQLKSMTMKTSPCKICVAIDMSFDSLMTEKDILKTLKQIQYCYAVNRRAKAPLQFHLTSFDGLSRQKWESVQGHMNWDVYFQTEDYISLFGQETVVYLTSDSPNVLEKLDENHAYIIGGIVDHNQHKGLCYKKALEKNIAHARLPIDEYIDMKTRKVLAINHVFEILVRWTEGYSWKEAFLSVLPQRKGAEPKLSNDGPNKELSTSIDTSKNNVNFS